MWKVSFAHEMYHVVNALKLNFFSSHLSSINLTHCEILANAKQSVILTKKNINIIVSFDNEFGVTVNFSMTKKKN